MDLLVFYKLMEYNNNQTKYAFTTSGVGLNIRVP